MREYVADSPRLAADTGAGPFHGRVYATWYQAVGEQGQYLACSTDGGHTWSRPVRFAADTAALHSWMIAVGRGGVVGVAWMRPEGDQPQRRCYRLVFTASSDGGETFLPPSRVSAEPSCNDTPRNRVGFGGGQATLVRRWRDGGDYHGFAALPNGGFQALWADSRTGVFQPWTARIDVQGVAAARPSAMRASQGCCRGRQAGRVFRTTRATGADFVPGPGRLTNAEPPVSSCSG